MDTKVPHHIANSGRARAQAHTWRMEALHGLRLPKSLIGGSSRDAAGGLAGSLGGAAPTTTRRKTGRWPDHMAPTAAITGKGAVRRRGRLGGRLTRGSALRRGGAMRRPATQAGSPSVARTHGCYVRAITVCACAPGTLAMVPHSAAVRAAATSAAATPCRPAMAALAIAAALPLSLDALGRSAMPLSRRTRGPLAPRRHPRVLNPCTRPAAPATCGLRRVVCARCRASRSAEVIAAVPASAIADASP